MSDLIVAPTKIAEVKPHPNADRLELAVVKGWQTVIPKGQFAAGDVAVFVPPDAVLPLELSDSWGVTQYLSKQRVKTVRLRGEMSFGFLVANDTGAALDEDLKDALGIVKWEPPEPTQKGLNNDWDHPLFHRYTDIQNFRNFPAVLSEGEEVIAVEKVHGTNSRIGLVSEGNGGKPSILCIGSRTCRKRLSGRDLYEWPLTKWYPEIMLMLRAALEEVPGASAILHGEIYGKVQDLRYDSPEGYRYAAFDLSVDGAYLPFDLFAGLASKVSLPTCPVAYRGAFSVEAIDAAASGATLVGGDHMREGIVIRPAVERTDPTLGRVILKRINDDYLVRKGGTENH